MNQPSNFAEPKAKKVITPVKTLEDEIDLLSRQSTTNSQISHALNGDVFFALYEDLAQYSSLQDLFDNPPDNQAKSLNCVLVLPTDAYNFGHYITLLYYPDKSLIY